MTHPFPQRVSSDLARKIKECAQPRRSAPGGPAKKGKRHQQWRYGHGQEVEPGGLLHRRDDEAPAAACVPSWRDRVGERGHGPDIMGLEPASDGDATPDGAPREKYATPTADTGQTTHP